MPAKPDIGSQPPQAAVKKMPPEEHLSSSLVTQIREVGKKT